MEKEGIVCMKDDVIEGLLSELMSLKYMTGYGEMSVISDKNRGEVRNAIIKWYNLNFGPTALAKISELEAKVYVYESIISKSNLGPLIEDVKKGE